MSLASQCRICTISTISTSIPSLRASRLAGRKRLRRSRAIQSTICTHSQLGRASLAGNSRSAWLIKMRNCYPSSHGVDRISTMQTSIRPRSTTRFSTTLTSSSMPTTQIWTLTRMKPVKTTCRLSSSSMSNLYSTNNNTRSN